MTDRLTNKQINNTYTWHSPGVHKQASYLKGRPKLSTVSQAYQAHAKEKGHPFVHAL